MRKNLSAIGNSLGIVIEKPILELLGQKGAEEYSRPEKAIHDLMET